MARVHVTESVWAEYRASLAGRPLSAALGELVEGEVDRARRKRLRAGELTDDELLDALDRSRELQRDLEVLVDRLQRLRRATCP